MSTYQQIYGETIETTASDPSNPTIGQIWYNTTNDILKYRTTVPGSNVWAAEGNLAQARGTGGGSPAGTDISALASGGASGPTTFSSSEEYDGTSWTAGGSLNRSTQRVGFGSFGSQTANAICGGGNPYTSATEEYDGTSWTSVNGLPVSKSYMGSSGTQVAGLISQGYNDPDQTDTQPGSQEYDGTNWSAGGNCQQGSYNHTQFGIQTAAVLVGGYNPSTTYLSRAEEYDGSTWTSVNSAPAVFNAAASGGSQNNGIVAGGSNSTSALSSAFEYDGTNFSVGGSMAATKEGNRASGQSAAIGTLVFAGSNPSAASATTELYSAGSPSAATKTVTGT